jgi:hypothetical protein
VINFSKFDWELKQMTMGLFEATTFTNQALATNLIKLLDQYGLKKKKLYM